MQISEPSTHCSYYHIHNLFTLKIRYNKQATRIKMSLYIPTVNTRELPQTVQVLSQYLPSVLSSTCFNDEKLPFALEVRSTEIGHLFEHILLEYLCYFKLSRGFMNAEYSGVTKWNWEQDPWGVFHITVNTGWDDADVFSQAIQQSILLLQVLLNQAELNSHQMLSPELLSPSFEQLEA